MIEFGANPFALPLYQKQANFGHFFMTKQMKQASVCVRLLSMIVTINLVAVLGGIAL